MQARIDDAPGSKEQLTHSTLDVAGRGWNLSAEELGPYSIPNCSSVATSDMTSSSSVG